MNKLILILIFLPLNLFALELKVGDVLLQPLDCWSCSLIEAQEKTIYSHMGIVIAVDPEVRVAEALGMVREMSLTEFNSRTQQGQKISVRRLRSTKAVKYIQLHKERFLEVFKAEFKGLKYDHDFLWNNFDEKGAEKLYCSEMVTKLFQIFLGIEIQVKRMKFDVNREQWIKYFKGNPPDGEWGNSPATFENSEFFYEAQEL